jgi:hypothetical protein
MRRKVVRGKHALRLPEKNSPAHTGPELFAADTARLNSKIVPIRRRAESTDENLGLDACERALLAICSPKSKNHTDDKKTAISADEKTMSPDEGLAMSNDEEATVSPNEEVATSDGEEIATSDGEEIATSDGEEIATSDGEETATSDGEEIATSDGEETATSDGEETATSDGEEMVADESTTAANSCDASSSTGKTANNDKVDSSDNRELACDKSCDVRENESSKVPRAEIGEGKRKINIPRALYESLPRKINPEDIRTYDEQLSRDWVEYMAILSVRCKFIIDLARFPSMLPFAREWGIYADLAKKALAKAQRCKKKTAALSKYLKVDMIDIFTPLRSMMTFRQIGELLAKYYNHKDTNLFLAELRKRRVRAGILVKRETEKVSEATVSLTSVIKKSLVRPEQSDSTSRFTETGFRELLSRIKTDGTRTALSAIKLGAKIVVLMKLDVTRETETFTGTYRVIWDSTAKLTKLAFPAGRSITAEDVDGFLTETRQ